MNTAYCGDSSDVDPVGHIIKFFRGITLLVVIKLICYQKLCSGEESWFGLWGVLSVLCHEKLCPIVLLFVYVLTFIYYFCWLITFIGIICERSFFRLCGNTPGHLFCVVLHGIVLKYCICCI